MEDLMVNVKVPRYLTKDLFSGKVVCFTEKMDVVKCSVCSNSEQCKFGYANFNSYQKEIVKHFGICVEETEDCTAVAGVIKSSLSPSETPPSGESERSEC